MKKYFALFLAVLLLLAAMSVASADDEFEPGEPSDRLVLMSTGEFVFDNAPEISVGVFYKIIARSNPESDYVSGYRKVVIPEDGEYAFYGRSPYDYGVEVFVHDKYDRNCGVDNISIKGRAPGVVKRTLTAGTYYFRGFWSTSWAWAGGSNYSYFAICAPSRHAGDLSEEEVIQEPTCTEPGYKAQRCLLCGGEVNRTEIPALGHTPGEEITVKAATCIDAGEKYSRCAVCGADMGSTIIPATGHTAGEEEILAEPTCSTVGVKVTKCTGCGMILSREVLPTVDHRAGQFIQVLAPTCTTKGRNEQHCLICNAILATEETEPFGHVPGSWEELVPVTATTNGLRVQRCLLCGETLNTETVPAPASGDN